MSGNPTAPENNLHHTVAYRSEEEWLEDLLGKGPGDPDFYGYPGEPITHNYPLVPTSNILISNELISEEQLPF